jgi:hypothetical protein
MLHRHSHREERSVADREQPALARRIQQLAESGDYEGFNAIIGAITRDQELDPAALEVVHRDAEFKRRVTETCHDAWARKHASPKP